jgi:elongation factor 1 alpha-like protein
MAHRRVKNIDYDDDYADDYEDEFEQEEGGLPAEEELSPEDEEKLQDFTKEVRTRLGPGSNGVVTDLQIREKLWSSWYDVNGVVQELKGTEKELNSCSQSTNATIGAVNKAATRGTKAKADRPTGKQETNKGEWDFF